ncbi:MAG: hypothetical protein JSW23_10775 [Planctomycetota bacterium]|nr:MAG: hypothetical protein JSW23_10775 [Planctomycetota bacterium]
MGKKHFNFGDVLGYGWHVMKADIWFFVGVGFIWMIISYIPTIVHMVLPHLQLSETTYWVLYTITTLTGWVIGIILNIGLIKIALSFCDEIKPTIGSLFDAWDCFWRYVGVAILYGLVVLGGLILLIIPGIVWAVKFGLCFYFVIDKGLGPIEALKASGRTTMGVKWELFGFGILCGMINYVGLLCLIVGIFATYPTVIVATALVYRQLSAQTPELGEFGLTTPFAQPDAEFLPIQ